MSAPVWQIGNDYDNGFSLTKFDNNHHRLYSGRPHRTCSHVESEIVGNGARCVSTRYRARTTSRSSPENGFVEECQESFPARWGEARSRRRSTTVDCVTHRLQAETTAHDGTMSRSSVCSCTQAYLDGKKK